MLRTETIMQLSFIDASMNELVMDLDNKIAENEKAFVVTANPEIVMYAENESEYRDIIGKATYLIPDGIGVIIGAKILGKPLSERLTGFDLMERLLQLANNKGYRVYFLGAEHDMIERSVANMQKKYDKLQIAGFHHGYFNANDKEIVNRIKASEPAIIFVGLGFPRQEMWIHKHLDEFEKGIFIGVGGSFDVWAGKVKRAPIMWQRLNIEWLYRLVQQPSRWKRMLVLPLFLLKILKMKVAGERIPHV